MGALPFALGAYGASACSSPSDEEGSRSEEAVRDGAFDVVIVGAGLAGLRAAQVLRAAGRRVVVLEARDRIGGRIHTDRDTLGVPAELGASWLHDAPKNPLVTVAAEGGIRTSASDYSVSTWERGARLSKAESGRISAAFERQLESATSSARGGESLRSALARVVGTLRGAALDRYAYSLATEIVYDFGAEAEELDAARLADPGDEEEHNLIVHEYDRVPKLLASGTEIRLRETVTSIEQSESGVLVRSTSGVLRAAHVIVTLPVGVLKSGAVRFSPPLSDRKRAALARMGMGCLSKTHLRFDRVFWPIESDFLGRIPRAEEKARWAYFVNVAKFGGDPTLIAFNGGDHAREVERMSQAEIVRGAMVALRTMFPDAPDPRGVAQTKWSADPLAGGSYSYLAPGARSDDRAALAAREGAVSFAGEATSTLHAATAHGAYLSGEAAARSILTG
ncbi:MAG: FAD-dependent oxidoreductase [Deltaproteobacteria bacterium]|nr:FAD-dependent oxidoreductase [Deltaproteobacteria bacterium]